MTARSESRGGRSVSRTGAALAVLLVTLVHLLACAHGPAPTGAARADSLLAATATCTPPSEPSVDPAARQAAPVENSPAQCWGTDEPTIQPPRAIAPDAEAVQDAQAALDTDGSTRSVREGAPPPPDTGTASAGRERARLGVWRT
ncbi:hypothetical protein [Streptomyces sp. NPDC058644]|uniref:hypothetical protein n=1 Tax=unclassified Streptomyces TaxID=2593676 RepID=UPI0036645D64